ncbi:unnamed protein product [Caretta caretta]
MERRLAANPEDPSLCGACWEKREELRALEDHRARGAFVRSHIRLLQEMDRSSRFFYALEKTRGAKKHVTCLLAEDGTPLMDLEEMCGRAHDFYTSLFFPDPTDPGAWGVLWEELPTEDDRVVLREPKLQLVLSAYADDVLLVVQDPGDLAQVEACQSIYSAASSARVNWVKSSGLVVGDWQQETHTDLATEDSWQLEWGDRFYFSHLTVHTAGVATLFSPDLWPEVLGVAEAVPSCLLHLRVCMEGLVVNLVNVYAPTSGPEQLQFYQQASAFLGTLDPHKCLVLGGDFNTTLQEIVELHSLVDVWRDHHPDDISTFTFVRVEAHRSCHSRLDHIYLSCFHLSGAHSSSIRPAPFSDHHLATMMASLCTERSGLAYWHFNNSLLEDAGFVAKAISLRLGSMLVDMVHRDQTYTVPGRPILDKLYLVQDLLELGCRDGLSFALLSLDREKAFDSVDHGYLLSTL